MITTNKERFMDMVSMRFDGHTLQEIGNKYGVSKQYVQQSFSSVLAPKKSTIENCIYPNLKKWCIKNGYTAKKLSEMIGVNQSTISIFLRGIRIPNIKTLLKISEITGLTVEQILAMEDEQTC